MWLIFVLLPLAGVAGLDAYAVWWWRIRRHLMEHGVPVTGEVVRINITVTERVDTTTRRVLDSSTTMRPVVRFTTHTGELITASPMRSGVDKLLIPGDPVKIRYGAQNPMRCVVDQRGATHGTSAMLAGLIVANIFLIGFASMGWAIAGTRPSLTPPASLAVPQVPGQLFGSGAGSRAGGDTTSPTTPTPTVGATVAGAWSAADGPLTVTVVKVVDAGGNVSLAVSAHDGGDAQVILPTFTYFTATDDRGGTYTAHPLAPITVPAGGTVADTLTLDQSVPASARSLNVTWDHVFSQDLALNGEITITGVPLPR